MDIDGYLETIDKVETLAKNRISHLFQKELINKDLLSQKPNKEGTRFVYSMLQKNINHLLIALYKSRAVLVHSNKKVTMDIESNILAKRLPIGEELLRRHKTLMEKCETTFEKYFLQVQIDKMEKRK
ncbi:hypothetical protein SNEBB_009751 [Seison nebaliae]|nr:hypothetical protein SNEBB_009751 [Seison nebaliae]